MKTLEELVLEIIKDFLVQDVLFTALDVSNLVKQTLPYARHKEVRDLVRNAWSTEIEPSNYDRTPITVTLKDSTQREALLYHPLSATWDLDNLYNEQQRNQTLTSNISSVSVTVPSVNGTLSKSDDGTLTVTTTPNNSVPSITAVTSPLNPKDVWAKMWQTQPSLFPRK